MNIQSISIVVPTKACVNKCRFCVSCMHDSPYTNSFDPIQYRKRIKYAANNGVNTLILTGDNGEVLQNRNFLINLVEILDKEHHPFPNVEIQTTGVMLDKEENIRLLRKLGVNTISLSVSDPWDDGFNSNIIRIPSTLRFNLEDLCKYIKEKDFNLRLSLNMTSVFDQYSPEIILKRSKVLGADQITFRKLYHTNDDSDQTKWVKNNACKDETLKGLDDYIAGWWCHNQTEEWREGGHGKPLYRLPFGAMAYSIMGMSTVVDDNCMSKEENEKLKYVILRENGKLYCQWDDEGSLLF
jgi:hypothetical protein